MVYVFIQDKKVIKIHLEQIEDLQTEYFNLIQSDVVKRLKNLKSAIIDIQSDQVKPFVGKFQAYKGVAWRLVCVILNKEFPLSKFKKDLYSKTISSLIRNIKKQRDVNLDGLLNFLEDLEDIKNEILKELLTGRAEDLEAFNNDILKKYSLSTAKDFHLLALAFNYNDCKEISRKIRDFFRLKNFVNYCPYCNQHPAMYNGDPEEVISVHQLDHFYCKASNPLLCYSLFNLVPGDWNCNSINKRDTPFSAKYHLNPYIDGFGTDIRFVPGILNTSESIDKIIIDDKYASSNKRMQIMGTGSDNKLGNVNVFKLERKYDHIHVKEEASKVYRMFKRTAKNIDTLDTFFNDFPGADIYDRYKYWYEENVRTPFEEKDFNKQRYSKLYRDLHDHVFLDTNDEHSNEIRSIIDNRGMFPS